MKEMVNSKLKLGVIISIISCMLLFTNIVNTQAKSTQSIEYLTEVTLTTIEVYEDNDSGGPGEIYCESIINDYEYTTSIKEADNDDTLTYNERLYSGWCSYLDVLIEVWDDDSEYLAGSDPDRMGSVDDLFTPLNRSISRITYDPDDERDEANVTFTIQTAGIRTVTVAIPLISLVSGILLVASIPLMFKKRMN